MAWNIPRKSSGIPRGMRNFLGINELFGILEDLTNKPIKVVVKTTKKMMVTTLIMMSNDNGDDSDNDGNVDYGTGVDDEKMLAMVMVVAITRSQ